MAWRSPGRVWYVPGHNAAKIVNHSRPGLREHTHAWVGISASRCTVHEVWGKAQSSVAILNVKGMGHFQTVEAGTSQITG